MDNYWSKQLEVQQVPDIIREVVLLNNRNRLLGKYSKIKHLGKGGFATCYLVKHITSDEVFAAKVISKESLAKKKINQSKLTNEIYIHKSLSQKHIVKFYKTFEDADFVYMLLEPCKYHTLKELLQEQKRLSEQDVAYLLYQLLQGVKYLHDNLIIHRDLKLANLFLTETMQLKIGDFGLAAQLNSADEIEHILCGTPNYIAPEILNADGHSFPVDVWAIGVTMYTLLIGTPPFESTTIKNTYKNIKKNNYSFPPEYGITNTARDLVSKILVTDPAKRLTVVEIMEQPFFKLYNSSLTFCSPTLSKYAASFEKE